MSLNVIKVEALSKAYRIRQGESGRKSYYALREVLTDSFFSTAIVNRKNYAEKDFWALEDVSFSVERGEHLGIIGKNGSGKTTLLKLLSRITEPTRGKITLNGRTASLLEIGTGFHPELTGRENIYLNGSILGMSRKEISRNFEEIIAFAEIDKFLDTPVKKYSSGMYLRLAFSVAAHLQPEIILIDEILAVGDASFQKKCLGKLEDSAEGSKTILFVSHNMIAVKQLCSRVIWLDEGKIIADGSPDDVINKYLGSASSETTEKVWDDLEAPGNDSIKIKAVKVLPQNGDPFISTDTPIELEFIFSNRLPASEINLSFVLWTLTGECVFNTASEVRKIAQGTYKGVCVIPANLLNNNVYSVEIMVIKDRSYAVFKQKDIINFEVYDGKRVEGWYGKWVGVVRPNLNFKLEKISD